MIRKLISALSIALLAGNVQAAAGVTLYQHTQYGGYAVSLGAGNYSLSQLAAKGVRNDDVSSLKVPAGWEIVLYEHDNFSGASLTRTADDADLINDGWNDRVSSVKVARSSLAGVMRVSGKKLLDANGNEFIGRGVNLQYGDWPPAKIGAIDPIASTGSNIIRLQLRKNTTEQQVRDALDKIVAKKMVAMVFYWEADVTCKADNAPFDVAIERFTTTWKSVLSDAKYQKYLMINPVNEWGKAAEFDNFKTKYRDAIVKLRNAGYKVPLVIDGSDCGQSPDAFTNGRAAQILSADPLNNTLLSIHAYWRYTNATKMADVFTAMNSTGYAWLWGELGSSQFEADTQWGYHGTDHPSLMKYANEQKIGYMAWSWFGAPGNTLNMSTSETSTELTWWGKELVNGTKIGTTTVPGIRATSKLVSY